MVSQVYILRYDKMGGGRNGANRNTGKSPQNERNDAKQNRGGDKPKEWSVKWKRDHQDRYSNGGINPRICT